jgi:outer membrane lipoprotein-sorting protein
MRYLPTACCALASCLLLQAETVPAILSRLDEAAPAFQALSANVQVTTYVAIISDQTVESGTLKMQRSKKGELRAILDFSKQPKDAKIITIAGNLVRMYYPQTNTYQDFDIGKSGQAVNQFFLLGFGSAGKDLAQSYDISSEGSENIAGQETTKLLLVPKTADVKQQLSKIEMWIPSNLPYSIQQKFYKPNGDYSLVSYGSIDSKLAIKGKLELKLPAGAKKSS